MKHKHAEVLMAIAEGKEVEWKIEGDDEWNKAYFLPYTPITHPDFMWRIKPITKPDLQTFLYAGDNGSDLHFVNPKGLKYTNLKLVFDGETGKLKSAEVLK